MKTYEILLKFSSGRVLMAIFTGHGSTDELYYTDLILLSHDSEVVLEKQLSAIEYKEMDTRIMNYLDMKYSELMEDFYANRQYSWAD